MIKVHFRLIVDDTTSFTKTIAVSSIPQIGTDIKAGNCCFTVTRTEQDLDAYDERHHEHGQFCDSLSAHLNEKMHIQDEHEEYSDVIKNLTKAGWKRRDD